MAQENNSNKKMDWKKTLIICAIIAGVAAVIILIIFSTEPTAKRVTETKETAMLVDVIDVEQGDYFPNIIATGTVVPAQDIILSPRISGEILERSKNFTPGGYVNKREILLQVDPADYQNLLQQAKSDLQEAVADLNIEMGRQEVAKKDYELLDESLSEENRALVLREPQLSTAKSRVEFAEAALKQAELDLERTKIRAPFNAHIITRNANVGTQVSPGTNLGRLVGLDNYWIITTVQLSKLRWLDIPENIDSEGSLVKIQNKTAWRKDEFREGYLYKLVGELADQTRMARIIISVPDPLALNKNSEDKPKLMIGEFVETQIQGKKIEDVIRLERDYVRKNNTVWVMKENKLNIQEVEILLQDSKYAYVATGLSEGDKVVTTNLSTVVEGAKLRLTSSIEKNNTDTSKTNENRN